MATLNICIIQHHTPKEAVHTQRADNANYPTGIQYKQKAISGVGNTHALFLSIVFSLSLSLTLPPSPSYVTCIIAFPLHWPRGKWSSHNVTVVILIDGVDTCSRTSSIGAHRHDKFQGTNYNGLINSL